MTVGRSVLLIGVLLVAAAFLAPLQYAPQNQFGQRSPFLGKVLILVGLVLIFFEWWGKRKKP
jgi:hypothetical protein